MKAAGTSTAGKWLALSVSVAVLLLSFAGPVAGVYVGCPWWNRLAYPFIHASFLHAFCNAWCLLSLVFYYNLHWWKVAASFAIAAAILPLSFHTLLTKLTRFLSFVVGFAAPFFESFSL